MVLIEINKIIMPYLFPTNGLQIKMYIFTIIVTQYIYIYIQLKIIDKITKVFVKCL